MGSHQFLKRSWRRTAWALCLLGGLLVQIAGAQVSTPEAADVSQDHVFGIGLAGGSATGIGLSFRHHFPGRFSYQITGGIIKVDEMSAAIGGELQYDVGRRGTARLFVAGGGGYYFAGKSGQNDLEAPFRAGLGVGGELKLSEDFHGNLELLFTYFSDGQILPLPQIGFHYYFH